MIALKSPSSPSTDCIGVVPPSNYRLFRPTAKILARSGVTPVSSLTACEIGVAS